MMLYPKTYKQYLPTEGELARQRQEPPSFAARFCEVYSNKDQRH